MTAVFEVEELSRHSAAPAAELRSVTKWYGRNRVLDGVTLRVGHGEIVALVGRSGSGKSTVLRVLSGLAGEHAGEREVLGAPAVAFQEPRLFPWRSVRDNVLYGLTRTKLSKAEALSRADRALDEVGLADKAQAWPLTLSGGQAQRVSLARALVAEPQLLLLDEPFGALDALTRLSMHRLLLNLWREHGFGVLLVTHDVDEAISLADTILVLDEGRLVHTQHIRNPRKPHGKHDSETDKYRESSLRSLVFRTIASAAIIALALSACTTGRDDKEDSAAPQLVPLSELGGLSLHVGDQKGGTEALLRAAGELDNVPYKIEFSTFTSGPPQIEAATAGKIDFAVTGNTPPIFGAASKAKIKVVSGYTNDASGDQILVPAESAAHSIADLRGKKVVVGKGSSAHGHLLLQLQKANLTVKDIQLVFLQPADAFTALSQGQADAWAIWDPYTAIAEKQLKVRTLVTAAGVSNGYGFGVAAQSALRDPQRNTALSDLVQRIARASAWARAHPQEWYTKYAAAIGIDPAAAELAQSRSLRLAIPVTAEVSASEQKLADLFAQSGQIQGKPTFSDFVDNRYDDVLKQFFTNKQ